MVWLSAGLALWVAAHLYKRLAPERRAQMGDKAKGIVAVLLVVSVVLMVLGYRSAETVALYSPVPGIGHFNNALMLVSVYLFGMGGTKGVLYPRMRHPMLWGTVIWAVAHLLVNGDLSSLVLFGGILVWAVAEMLAINRAERWTPPTNGRGIRGDAMNLVGTLALFGVIAAVHTWLGYSPFLGTYG